MCLHKLYLLAVVKKKSAQDSTKTTKSGHFESYKNPGKIQRKQKTAHSPLVEAPFFTMVKIRKRFDWLGVTGKWTKIDQKIVFA